MPAYYSAKLADFVKADPETIVATLTSRYSEDRYFQLLTSQTFSWNASVPILQKTFSDVAHCIPEALGWGILLEYPLYRLRRRIDVVAIAGRLLFVLELKVGSECAESADLRQIEEYALDLRDFHKESSRLPMQPVLCCTDLSPPCRASVCDPAFQIQDVVVSSARQLANMICERSRALPSSTEDQFDLARWDHSAYEPVPTIIEAATAIFAGHSVKDIARANAQNLKECSDEVLRLVREAKELKKKRVIVVTGVPGAGKTLAGLHVAHGASGGDGRAGGIVYLSGNTPLVLVIREALAQDERARSQERGERKTLAAIRHQLQTRIQHINDFLKEYVTHDPTRPPAEDAIVFDEAQRAWDHKHGKDKFGRDASEPAILLEIMGRNDRPWAAIVCLVGAGQEINTGEAGMVQWGNALKAQGSKWELFAPQSAINGDGDTAGTALFPDDPPANLAIATNPNLRLTVSVRSYRSELVSNWVNAVLAGEPDRAAEMFTGRRQFPVTLTRSIDECREWLRDQTRGQRRAGLLASTTAVRLLAEGLGASLTVQDKHKICHWYLKPVDDYRSSNSLEVTANEYTCQGLELDFVGLCWGGDFVRDKRGVWSFCKLSNTTWNRVHSKDIRRFITNKYRVFLTRAREGMVLFVPRGNSDDVTRPPEVYDRLADYLLACGASAL